MRQNLKGDRGFVSYVYTHDNDMQKQLVKQKENKKLMHFRAFIFFPLCDSVVHANVLGCLLLFSYKIFKNNVQNICRFE